MRSWVFVILLVLLSFGALPQQDDSPSQQSKPDNFESSAPATEMSSSKDTRIDLSPPADDQKSHPMSGAAISDAEDAISDIQELHPWDPHKAAKDIEVGDVYFKKMKYRAALERYKDVLTSHPGDAVAQF